MAKKINFSEIVDQQSLDAFAKSLEVIEKSLKDIIALSSKTVKDNKNDNSAEIKARTKAIRDAENAEKGLTEVQKQQIAASHRMAQLRKEEREKIQQSTSAYKKLTIELRDNKNKYKDLAASGKANTKEAKELLKTIRQQDKEFKKLNKSVGDNNVEVGNYTGALKKVSGAFIGIYASIKGATKLFNGFKETMMSTQTTGDAYVNFIAGLNNGMEFFKRTLANWDWSNFLGGMRDAIAEGQRYSKMLDTLADRKRSLELQITDIEIEQIRQRSIVRNRDLELAARQNSIEKYVELEEEKLKLQTKFAQESLANQLQNAREKTKLDDDVLIDFIKNAEKYESIIEEGLRIETNLQAKSTRQKTIYTRTGTQIIDSFDQDLFDANEKRLTDTERRLIAISKGLQDFTDAERDKLAETFKLQQVADKQNATSLESLVRLRIQLNNELKAENKQIKKQTDVLKDNNIELEKRKELLSDTDDDLNKKMKVSQDNLDNIKKIDDEIAKREADKIENTERALSIVDEIEQKYYQRKQERIDREIEANKRKQDTLRILAAQGSEDAKNNLAFEEQQAVKLEALRQKTLKKQQQTELVLTTLKTYSGYVAKDEPNALAKTFTDTLLLQAFIKSLPAFYEGTMDLGKTSNPLDNKGGRLIIGHDGEGVIPEKDMIPVRASGIKTTAEMANMAIIGKKGLEASRKKIGGEFLNNKIEELIKVTKDKPVYLGTEIDKDNSALIYRIQEGNRLINNHKRISKLG